MNSHVVSKEIKGEIWSLLRHDGFTKFVSRTAWRYLPEQIHVINFQSFNSYIASTAGCTTFSFSLNLGIYFRCIPEDPPIVKEDDSAIKPQEYHCHLRLRLLKGLVQQVLPRRDVWYVEPDGSNLPETIADARIVLEQEGLPWFRRLESLQEVLRLLMESEDFPGCYSAQGSPSRKRMIGYLARRFQREDIAVPMIAEAEQEIRSFREMLSAARGKRGRDQVRGSKTS